MIETARHNRYVRLFTLAALIGLSCVAGWRIGHGLLADVALAGGEANAALAMDANHPDALLAVAEAHLHSNQLDDSSIAARRLLGVQPADGRGYRILAQVAVARGQLAHALQLFQIAAKRAPRDLPARAWLAQHALAQGDAAAALVQIDQVLTLSPQSGAQIFPALLTLSKSHDFADALAEVLESTPTWRSGMLEVLRNAGPDDRDASDQVMRALEAKGGMDPQETAALIDALMQAGQWGEAYARWAGPIVATGQPLPLLFNAGFTQDPAGSGFDWRMPATPGVLLDFEQGQGMRRTLHVRFLGRRVVNVFLEHPMMLPPGTFIFRFRQRSNALRSENGISWTLSCADSPASLLAETPALNGSRQGGSVALRFVVPANECRGQWLRLGNAGGVSIGQVVGGDAWFDDVSIQSSVSSGERKDEE